MQTLGRMLVFAKRYWAWMALSVVCMLAATGLNLLLPQIIRLITDRCLMEEQYRLLPYLSIAIVATAVIKGFFAFGQSYSSDYVALRTIYDIRNRLFDHTQRLSFSYHDEAETGQLISRATSDVDALRMFIGPGLMHLVANLFMVIGISIICIHMNWRLALLSLSAMPFLAMTAIRYRMLIRPLYSAVQDQVGNLTGVVQQNLMGIRTVKAFAREEHQVERFSREARELFDRTIASTRVSSIYGPVMDFITAFGVTFVLWYGGMQVVHHQLSVGQLLAFYTYLLMFVWPVRIIVWVIGMSQNAVASADRIFEILDTHPEAHLKDGRIELKDCRGHVEFKGVSFGYSTGAKVLCHIDLDAKPGEMVALLGPTGSGKSTIINLIPRFYDVTEGAILIDGVDIRDYRLESLRRNIGIVAQETFLFGDTVRENIAYGKPSAPMEEVVEAAKAANIHDFIMTLPEQYDTKIGERGVNLSGGQKQRVAIARALLMNPPILILDDSMSSVDTETEALIQKALVSLTESRTTFVIAQRVSTVKRADKIVVLDKGRIAECGTHEELLVKGGLYSEIYNLQFCGQELQ